MRKLFLLWLAVIGALNSYCQDFNLYDLEQVREVKVYFQDSIWERKLHVYKDRGKDKRLIGKLDFNGVRYDSVGARFKGNSSFFNVRKYDFEKLPFNVKTNFKKIGQTLPGGYCSLKLSNAFRDPSFLREVLSYEIVGKYMPSPRANFVKLYINDDFFGLYHNSESVDELFLDNNFGGHNGALIKCDPIWGAKKSESCPPGDKASLLFLGEDSTCYYPYYEKKSKDGWKDLIELIQILNNNPDEIENILNVDQVLWMHAFNNVVVNLDSYSGKLCHNYYLYRDSYGRFQPVVWDMNLAFGGFRFEGGGNKQLTDEEMKKLSPFLHFKNEKRPLISKLLANKKYRNMYVAHLRTILKENFSDGAFRKRCEELARFIEPYVEEDKKKFYSFESFKTNVESTAIAGKVPIIGILELMEPRIEYLSNHPAITKVPPAVLKTNHIKQGGEILISAEVENATGVNLYYRNEAYAGFTVEVMNADGGTPGKFLKNLPYKKGMEYYFVVENEEAVIFSPERASFEYYTVQ